MQGKVISGYTLKKLLGKGGMAEVWYAENSIGKTASVKMLLPKLCEDQNVMSRFRTEAMVMVTLSHPNIRQVYDYGEIDGRPAIVMEYLEGDDLKERMKHGQRFSEADLEKWWNQLADALNYTHQKGIVHRDIKPGNIFVDRQGNIKLLDFGIAKVRESISSTQTGQKLGTLMYMSPEQVRDSKHIDYHTDVYSLAVTFVNLLTGKKPYNTETCSDFDISEQIVYHPLDLSGVPEKWAAFLEPYLEKDPLRRPELRHFSDEPAFHDGIVRGDDDATQHGSAPERPVAPQPGRQPASQPQKKGKKGLWIALAFLAVSGALLVGLTLGSKREESQSIIPVDRLDESHVPEEMLLPNFPTDNENNPSGNVAIPAENENVPSRNENSNPAGNITVAPSSAPSNVSHLEDVEEAQNRAKEDEMFRNCTTIAGCDRYLNQYPHGKYVDQVRKKRSELLEDEDYRKCTTISGCRAYLSKYPSGRYANQVRQKLQQLEAAENQNNNGIINPVEPSGVPQENPGQINNAVNQAIQNDNNNCELRLRTAEEYYNRGDYNKAAKMYQQVIDICGEGYGGALAKYNECVRLMNANVPDSGN